MGDLILGHLLNDPTSKMLVPTVYTQEDLLSYRKNKCENTKILHLPKPWYHFPLNKPS